MTTHLDKMFEPIKELNELTFKTMQEISTIQLQSFQDNAKIGMYALNTATDVKDYDSFKNYLESQVAVTQYVSDTVAVDVNDIHEVGKSFANEAKEVVEKSII